MELEFALESDKNMMGMNAVPFDGPDQHNPHSEMMASDEAMLMLDIPDRPRLINPKKATVPTKNKLIQRGDLFAQIETG